MIMHETLAVTIKTEAKLNEDVEFPNFSVISYLLFSVIFIIINTTLKNSQKIIRIFQVKMNV